MNQAQPDRTACWAVGVRRTAEMLRTGGLRPTRQRIALAELLFARGNRHVSAEQLHGEAHAAGMPVSLATVYNALNQFSDAGLLRAIAVDTERAYYDTKTGDHHHFFFENTGEVVDIPGDSVSVENLPAAPEGYEIARIDVVVRLRPVSR
jgi:Fur family iron response transcriptional regulator